MELRLLQWRLKMNWKKNNLVEMWIVLLWKILANILHQDKRTAPPNTLQWVRSHNNKIISIIINNNNPCMTQLLQFCSILGLTHWLPLCNVFIHKVLVEKWPHLCKILFLSSVCRRPYIKSGTELIYFLARVLNIGTPMFPKRLA